SATTLRLRARNLLSSRKTHPIHADAGQRATVERATPSVRAEEPTMMFHHYGSTGAAALALALAACATLPPPPAELPAPRSAIESANVAGAGKTAPRELSQAREKLVAAEIAATNRDNERARRLAKEALADAQLAQAKSSTARSREGLAQAEAALRALREEA